MPLTVLFFSPGGTGGNIRNGSLYHWRGLLSTDSSEYMSVATLQGHVDSLGVCVPNAPKALPTNSRGVYAQGNGEPSAKQMNVDTLEDRKEIAKAN